MRRSYIARRSPMSLKRAGGMFSCHSKMSLLMLATCGRRFVENSVINLWFRTGLYAKSHGEKKLSVETNFAATVGFYD